MPIVTPQRVELSPNLVSSVRYESQGTFAYCLAVDSVTRRLVIENTAAFGWDDNPKTAFSKNFKSIEHWFGTRSVCFVMVQLGELPLSSKYAEWLLIQFVPDTAPNADRLSFSKITELLLEEFRNDHKIVQVMHATTKEECTIASFQQVSAL